MAVEAAMAVEAWVVVAWEVAARVEAGKDVVAWVVVAGVAAVRVAVAWVARVGARAAGAAERLR